MLSLMSRRPRAVGLVAEVLSAANPTFGYRGQYAGQNAVRVVIPAGIWNLRVQYDGTEPFRVFNAADNSVLADQTTSVDRLFNLDKPLEFYISVNNWTTQVGRKFIVTLEEAPPQLPDNFVRRLLKAVGL